MEAKSSYQFFFGQNINTDVNKINEIYLHKNNLRFKNRKEKCDAEIYLELDIKKNLQTNFAMKTKKKDYSDHNKLKQRTICR